MRYCLNKKGEKISALGFGVMRLPRIAGSKDIDVEASKALIRHAYELGINYFDTAFIYDGGKNEAVLGEAVEEFREHIFITTKIPPYMLLNVKANKILLDKSLARLKTDYIDYFFLHAMPDYEEFLKLQDNGTMAWLQDLKAKGVIHNIGFSFHGKYEDYEKLIDAFDWDSSQIQLNYWDKNYQAGLAGLHYAEAHGVPVSIMEPLRGGSIVNKQPQESLDIFHAVNPTRSMAEWGLMWVWNQSGVMTVLSGMNETEQLLENVRIAELAHVGCLSDHELECYELATIEVLKKNAIPCTGCRYCMPCPHGVDIPQCFQEYNSYVIFHPRNKTAKYVAATGGLSSKPGFASQCIGCGACEKKCPQHLPIREHLQTVKHTFEYRGFLQLVKAARFVKGTKRKEKREDKK